MLLEYGRRADRPVAALLQEVAATLARFQDLAAGHLESMGDSLIHSRDAVSRSRERLSGLARHEDRRWR